MTIPLRAAAYARLIVPAVAFVAALTLRIRGIDRHFWMLGDQIRDWSLALGPFSDLPLVGPATHVGGYTIGPAFYWILWLIRLTFGPWFDNLPHAGGIGQAALQSAADAFLLYAIWQRTRSVWIALATTVLLVTAAYDLCLSALVWNPMMGAALVKIATALILLDWPSRSKTGVVVTAAVAWCAVHSYTGAIFAVLGIFAAMAAPPLIHRDWRGTARTVALIAAVVAVLQIPLIVHQVSTGFRQRAMGAVTGSLGRVVSGEASPQLAKSWKGFSGAFTFIQGAPSTADWQIWLLVASAAVVAFRYRRDVPLLSVTLLPPLLAVIGYALYVGDFLDSYYYFSLMPAAVLTLVLGLTSAPWPRVSGALGALVLIAAVSRTPARLDYAATMHRMPEYGVLVDASRRAVAQHYPLRAVVTDFPLQPTVDSGFIYRILGGRLSRDATVIAVISRDGSVSYRRN